MPDNIIYFVKLTKWARRLIAEPPVIASETENWRVFKEMQES